MLYFALFLLLIAVVLCLGLSRAVPTRVLGFTAAAASAGAALMLGVRHWLPATMPAIPDAVAIAPYGVVDFATRTLPPVPNIGLVLALLGGGAVALAVLTLALAPTVRGFGTLFAWALLALAAALLGLCSSGLLLPIAWSIAVLATYGAARASGAVQQSEGIPNGLTLGMLASLLLAVGLLLAQESPGGGVQLSGGLALLCILLACLILSGSAPFHATFDEAAAAPAALGGLLYGLVLPLLALDTLFRGAVGGMSMLVVLPGEGALRTITVLLPPLGALAPFWQGGLLAVGTLGLLAGTAGALQERTLRRLLARMVSWQVSLVVLLVALQTSEALLAVPALLLNLTLSTLLGVLAAATMERMVGSDDFTRVVDADGTPLPPANLRLTGVFWGVAAASALGLPPLWGFWGRAWLLQALAPQHRWLVPLLLFASVAAALVYLAPLARFWFLENREQLVRHRRYRTVAVWLTTLLALLTAVPLLLLGVAPQLWVVLAGAMPPVNGTVQLLLIVLTGAVLLLGVVLTRMRWSRQPRTDSDMIPVVLAPDGLAQRMQVLAWVGHPARLFRWLWQALLIISDGVGRLLWLFEQRFYLVGVLAALMVLLFLMAQS